MKKPGSKKMTTEQKYRSLKRQTEQAGMSVREQNGRLSTPAWVLFKREA